MTRKISTLISLLLIISSLFSFTSCSLSAGYVTRAELEDALSSAGGGEVNAGDNYSINISSSAQNDIIAAAKGLLSAVSIYCNFTVYRSSGYGPASQKYESTEQTAGSGVIYRIDKENGDAYIITNYHVVYYHQSAEPNYISSDIKIYLYGQEYTKYAIPATYIGGSMN